MSDGYTQADENPLFEMMRDALLDSMNKRHAWACDHLDDARLTHEARLWRGMSAYDVYVLADSITEQFLEDVDDEDAIVVANDVLQHGDE